MNAEDIELVPGVIFDATNEEGRIIHTISGECLALDPIATLLLQASLQETTSNETLAYARARIDANDEQLKEGLETVIHQLLAYGFICRKKLNPCVSYLKQSLAVVGVELAPTYDLASVGGPPVSSDREEQSMQIHPNPQCHVLSDEGEQPTLLHYRHQTQISVTDDWEVFLTGTRINLPLAHLSLLTKIYAMGCMITILTLLFFFRTAIHGLSFVSWHKIAKWIEQREWSCVCRVLSSISRQSSSSKLRALDRETMIRLAHQELASCHVFIRLLAPVGRCLVRSAALCAYLMAIGLPSQLVIGRAQFSLSSTFGFHAWVEIAGTVINDLEELVTGYIALQRVS